MKPGQLTNLDCQECGADMKIYDMDGEEAIVECLDCEWQCHATEKSVKTGRWEDA